MGYTQFLMWVAKQGLKNKVLQKYLNKAWQEASKAGKPIIEKNFPALLKKAQDLKTNFKTFEPKVVPKEIVKPKLQIDKSKQIIEGMKSKDPKVVNIGDRIIKQMQKEGKTVKFDDLVRIYGKKPPNLKAEGGIAQLLGEGGPVYSAEDINRRFKTLQEVRQGIAPSSYLYLRDELVKDALASGLISEEDYFNKWQKPFFGERGEKWTDAIEGYEQRNFNEGGLAGMLGETQPQQVGLAQDREALVRKLYDAAGGFEGTNKTFLEFMADVMFEGDYIYAKGGRVGLKGGGMTPSEKWMRNYYFDGKGGYDQWMSFQEFQMGPGVELWNRHIGKAEGGRIGFQEGQGIMSRVGDMVDMRNIPYYSGKALQGLVNSAETLSKLPFAAGELGSKLLQQKPKKEMFMEAIENITPGSWSENVGLTSLVEGMGEKRPEDAKTVGGILGLGTEIAVPTGGAFKAGQYLLNKASKAMGKVKDGKTLNKLVDEKLTDSGQSRRDFMSLVGSSGLMVALKSLGLGSVFKAATKVKPSDDVVMRLRTFIDDSDVETDFGPVATGKWGGAFDVEGLSKAAQKTLVGIMKDIRSTRRYPEDTLKKLATGEKKNLPKSVQYYDDISPEDAPYILEQLQKAGHKVKYEHVSDMGGYSVDDLLDRFKNHSLYKGTAEGAEKYKKFKEKTDKWSPRKRDEYHGDITDDWGIHHNPDVEEFYDLYYGVDEVIKKAEGGRIGLDTGGPPIEPYSTSDPKAAAKEIARRSIEMITEPAKVPIDKDIQLMFDLDRAKIGGTKDFLGGEIDFGINKGFGRDDLGYGFNWSKKFSDGGSVLQRPMFYQGGLTKTVPPKKGPMPQGLQSDVYDGIMRPGVINGRN